MLSQIQRIADVRTKIFAYMSQLKAFDDESWLCISRDRSESSNNGLDRYNHWSRRRSSRMRLIFLYTSIRQS